MNLTPAELATLLNTDELAERTFATLGEGIVDEAWALKVGHYLLTKQHLEVAKAALHELLAVAITDCDDAVRIAALDEMANRLLRDQDAHVQHLVAQAERDQGCEFDWSASA